MQLLLDTHALIWFFSGDKKLSDTARNLIEDIDNINIFSVASAWEMAIKQSKGRLTLSLPLDDYFQEKINLGDFQLLDIKLSHLKIISQLNFLSQRSFRSIINCTSYS